MMRKIPTGLALLLAGIAVLALAWLSIMWGMQGVDPVVNPGFDPQEQCVKNLPENPNRIDDVYFIKQIRSGSGIKEAYGYLSNIGLECRQKVVLQGEGEDLNRYAFIYGLQEVRDIAVYHIDAQQAQALQWNWEEYIKTYEPLATQDVLGVKEVLIIEVVESDPVPSNLIAFSIGKRNYYWIIKYGGIDSNTLIEDIHEIK